MHMRHILWNGGGSDWIILRHDYLAPAKYVDAIDALPWGDADERIYAVTELQGDVLVWEPYKWGESCYLLYTVQINTTV